MLCRRAIIVFVGGGGVAAVHVEPVAEHGSAEAIDSLRKQGERGRVRCGGHALDLCRRERR